MKGVPPTTQYFGPNNGITGTPARLPPFKPTPDRTKSLKGQANTLTNGSLVVTENVLVPFVFSFIFAPTAIPGVNTTIYDNVKSAGAALAYRIDFNSDGTLSFFVTDSSGTTEVRTTYVLEPNWSYSLTFAYTYDGS